MMTVSMKLEGDGAVKAMFLTKKLQAGGCTGSVGYSAPYALFVHEDLEAAHPVGKAKFLTGPMRRLAGVRNEVIAAVLRRGGSLYKAVLMYALLLKTASTAECPVDTGRLKESAYTEVVPR